MEVEIISQLNNTLSDLKKCSGDIRAYVDYQGKRDRLEKAIDPSEDPGLRNDPKHIQEVDKGHKALKGIVLTLDNTMSDIEDSRMLIEMAVEGDDGKGFATVQEDMAELEKQIADLEFK